MKTTTSLYLTSFILVACSAAAPTERASTTEAPAAHPPAAVSTLAAVHADEHRGLALRSLASVREVVARGNASKLGLSAEDIDGATLGEPVLVYPVSGEKVLGRSRTPGADAHLVLGEATEMMYPVVVGGTVRSAVVLGRTESGWQLASIGRAGLAKSVDAARSALGGDKPVSLVVMHDLGVELVAHDDAGRLALTSLRDVSAAGWRAGETVDADEGFERVATYARARTR
jgi:hypothetical protein